MQKVSKIATILLLAYSGVFSVNAFAANSPEPVVSEMQQVQAEKPQDSQISINQATAEELAAALNGVGLKKAQGIVNYREQYGAFTHVEQLQEVPGIGAAILERNLAKIKL